MTSIPKPDREIDRRRGEFPGLGDGIHLLSHSLGPVPRTARESMLAYLDRWRRHGSEDAWAEEWWTLSEEVGDRIARFLGGEPGTVQIQPNTSVALSTVASCLDYSKRNRIVITELDFPSTQYIWHEQRRLGAEIVAVPSEGGVVTPLEKILDAIDDRTALVAISHTSFLSSHRLDPVPIIEKAHARGARVLLDCYQSAGIVELKAAGWKVDFLIGGTIKWLCGGPACGYLYVRPGSIRDLEPRLTGWIAHADPFRFAPGAIEYAATVRRFAQGTPNIPGLYSCLPGLKLVEEVGLPNLWAESRRRTQWMVEFARERGWKLNSPVDPARRGGSVMIGVKDGREMVRRLAERRVFVDARPNVGLRISPHFFNTDEEVQEGMETLARLKKG